MMTAAPNPRRMSPKQQRFCQEYLVDLNGTQAAIRAGYSPRTAGPAAVRLLADPRVLAKIQAETAERSQRTQVAADRVLEELAAMALYDAGEIGRVPMSGPDDIKNLPADLRRAVVGWSWDRHGNFVLKLAAKTPQLELIGQHLGMWKSRMEHSGPNGGPIPIQGMNPAQEAQFDEFLSDLRDSLKPPGNA